MFYRWSRHLVNVTISRQGRASTPWRRQKPRPPPPPAYDEGRGTPCRYNGALSVVAAEVLCFFLSPRWRVCVFLFPLSLTFLCLAAATAKQRARPKGLKVMVCNGATVRACYSDRTYVLGLLKAEEKADERWGGNRVRRCEETRHLPTLVVSPRCVASYVPPPPPPPRPTTLVGYFVVVAIFS